MEASDVETLGQLRRHRLDQAMRRLAVVEQAWRDAHDRSRAAVTALRDETERALRAGEVGVLARWLEPAERRLQHMRAAFAALSLSLAEARSDVDRARLGVEQVDALRDQLTAVRKAARERREIANSDALASRRRAAAWAADLSW
ncbi:hypothetical protein [Marinivivus vitaminiproducens]|uniref:hypothetical protein n=1 Tax=Marinivivus vitaminiproducens TaxID=3035935 RepID=UPI0027A5577F|nr:hypothetical protein P4R82_19250 [Geminicoccaceae bacterium SCSIO 64248]